MSIRVCRNRSGTNDHLYFRTRNMHATLRYIMTKTTDLVAMSGVVRRMFRDDQPVFGNTRAKANDVFRMTRDMDPLSDDMLPMSRNMVGMSDNNAGMSPDMSAMSCDLAFVPDDMEAMTENYVALSLVSLLRSLNPLLLLRDLVAKLRHELSEWYWRMLGLSDPVQRKIYQETDFDDLFTVEYIKNEVDVDHAYYVKHFSQPRPVHPLLEFLVVDKEVKRDAMRMLAVLRIADRKVLNRTDQQRFWSLSWLFALLDDSSCRPLSPRPPPFAAC